MSRKVLIVGQGLAGSLLAHELDLRGVDLLVIDPGRAETATRVAAGLLNPFTGPRFQSPEPPQAWFASAVRGWRRMEQRLSARLLQDMKVSRLIRDASELERLRQRRADPGNGTLLGEWLPPEASSPLNDPLGRTEIRAARVDLPLFLDRTRDWLHEHGRLVYEELDYADLAFTAHGAGWKHHELAAVVCCQGYQARTNPWFATLPWRVSHGESLVLRAADGWPGRAVSRGRNLVPLGGDQAWLGATYGRQTEPTTTATGRQVLLDSLGELLKA
ncbi:MAG: FAD-binding oxidoreductase, partial [Ectothiorhodospiraceae bacterium]|nr:FAD-binding oxidoreductase [Ectothiorhodospiraceae bacterium]